MTDLENKILEIIKFNDGIKASKIAKQLGTTRHEINHFLHLPGSPLSTLCKKDIFFNWHYAGEKAPVRVDPPVVEKPAEEEPSCWNCIYYESREKCGLKEKYHAGCAYFRKEKYDHTLYDLKNQEANKDMKNVGFEERNR